MMKPQHYKKLTDKEISTHQLDLIAVMTEMAEMWFSTIREP